MNQKIQKILLTGANGQLGNYLAHSGLFPHLLTPPRKTLDLCKPLSIKKYFEHHSFDAVIHTAAIARVKQSQSDPARALETNLIGTARLVREILAAKNTKKKAVRFIHISTDGVYPSIRGPYAETDAAIPYNHYGWTKLGAECSVHLLPNFCIVRTRFFDPENLPLKQYAMDAFTSSLPLKELARAIQTLVYSNFIGTVNVGGKRLSNYQRFRKFRPAIQPCRIADIQSQLGFPIARDASLDCKLWKKISAQSSHA